MVPDNLKYTKEHEWIKIEGEECIIGITDYAQASLGDITYVELPDVEAKVSQNEPFGVVESVKAASDIYAPVSGEVIEVNKNLNDTPEIINQSPYDEGWIARIKIEDMDELKNLMDSAAYEELIKEKE